MRYKRIRVIAGRAVHRISRPSKEWDEGFGGTALFLFVLYLNFLKNRRFRGFEIVYIYGRISFV